MTIQPEIFLRWLRNPQGKFMNEGERAQAKTDEDWCLCRVWDIDRAAEFADLGNIFKIKDRRMADEPKQVVCQPGLTTCSASWPRRKPSCRHPAACPRIWRQRLRRALTEQTGLHISTPPTPRLTPFPRPASRSRTVSSPARDRLPVT